MGEGFAGTLESMKHACMWIFSCMEHLLFFMFAFFVSVFTEYQDMIRAVLVCSVIDWILAVAYNFRIKNILSTKMLKFVGKLTVYGIAFIVAYCINSFIGIEGVGNLLAIVIVLAELQSLVANALLLFPNNNLLKFLEKFIEKEKKSKMKDV